MKVTVLFFGYLVEKSGTTSKKFENIKNIDSLVKKLNEQISGFEKLNYKIALNQNIIQKNKELKNGDTVALLPPFSGG